MRDAEIEHLAEEAIKLGIGPSRWRPPHTEEVEQVERWQSFRKPLGNAQTLPVRRPSAPPYSSKPHISPKQVQRPTYSRIDTLPAFHHRTFSPNSRPRVVYTTDPAEADDLLTCLRGPVLGFDLEWPVAGKYKTLGPDGRLVEKKVGMKWNGISWVFEQARTALVQLSDEKLIVLVHLRDMQGES